MGDRWGPAGPPEDAYSRVTDPARYAPLHDAARDLLDRLERDHAVRRETATAPDPGGGAPAPLVRLVPADPDAAALAVVFTRFPGLLVHSGQAHVARLPDCGCDACDETVPECLDRLDDVVAATTAGTLGERIVHGAQGWAHEVWYAAPGARWGGSTPLDRAAWAALRAELPAGTRTYAPWPPLTT